MNLQKHQMYLLEKRSDSFEFWSAIIRINTEGKSLIMKLGPDQIFLSRHKFHGLKLGQHNL